MNVTNVPSPWDRDENAARNILDRALSEVGLILPVRGGLDNSPPEKREATNRVGGSTVSILEAPVIPARVSGGERH